MEPQLESQALERLTAPDEKTRYQALLELRERREPLSAALLEKLAALDLDPSRAVRQLAREVRAHLEAPVAGSGERAAATPLEPSPGNVLLALISWGSAITGLLGTGMSLINYYFVGRFPFPNALDVLFLVNLVLVVPYLVLGGALLFPGRTQKRLAWYYAWFSLGLSAVLIFGLQPLFERYWAFHFLQADAVLFQRFLNPIQLLTVFLPVLSGQSLQLYFLSQYLAPAPPAVAGNDVDTPSPGD